MKEIINIYAVICVVALALKYAIRLIRAVAEKKEHATVHDHGQEHTIAHLVKLILLIIIAAWLIYSY